MYRLFLFFCPVLGGSPAETVEVLAEEEAGLDSERMGRLQYVNPSWAL